MGEVLNYKNVFHARFKVDLLHFFTGKSKFYYFLSVKTTLKANNGLVLTEYDVEIFQ